MSDAAAPEPKLDFVRQIVADDAASGKWQGQVVTRFPPEPNGYLHIGHAKSICLNFGIAKEFGGHCNLRYDDTNPTKEDDEYVRAIETDVRWLGFDWGENRFFASDYFERMYELAERLIEAGKAYVDDQSLDEIRASRGTVTKPGTPSPNRERSVADNLDLFRRMRAGEFPNGAKVLRAKADMASPNMHLRDPLMYRIVHASHHRTGDQWCIYPMYDWAHGLEDSFEGVTQSICTLEFENHRPLYDWFMDQFPELHHSQQIEFAKLNLTFTVTSKRRTLELVESGIVSGWDDPRLPTISGLRRRGFSPEAIRNFCAEIGVTKFESTTDYALLEHHLRKDLNLSSPRTMAVLHPLSVTISNPDALPSEVTVPVNPERPEDGDRTVPVSATLAIEADDFMEDAPKKFFRLAPGRTVRLRGLGFITCDEVIKDGDAVTSLVCRYEPMDADLGDRKVKATMHWVSQEHAVSAEVRLYEHLFLLEDPTAVAEGEDWKAQLNPNSLEVLTDCLVDPSLATAPALARCQFERLGYFCVDPDSSPDQPIFNRTVPLRDAWAKKK
jgi:glutaminyl-tRNA synthetase